MTAREGRMLGSARVSRAGFGVAPKQSFPAGDVLFPDAPEKESSRWRDASASTRDACATQANAATLTVRPRSASEARLAREGFQQFFLGDIHHWPREAARG